MARALSPLTGRATQENRLKKIMDDVLRNSQRLLEGIVTRNFAKITRSAEVLIQLSKTAEWQVLKTPRYELHSARLGVISPFSGGSAGLAVLRTDAKRGFCWVGRGDEPVERGRRPRRDLTMDGKKHYGSALVEHVLMRLARKDGPKKQRAVGRVTPS
jgi:hypothetical protein